MWSAFVRWLAKKEIQREREKIAAAVHDSGHKEIAHYIYADDMQEVRGLKKTDQHSVTRRWRQQKGINW